MNSAPARVGPDGQARTDVPARSRRTVDVPTRLIQVATELFAKRGFESTSVQSIVEAAGVTKGAMYHHFDSKDDLLYEIYARMLRMQTTQLEKFANAELPVTQRVYAAAADVVETTVANFDESVIFFRSMHQLHPDKQKQVRTERRRYHEQFRKLIEEGQQAGEFRDDVPADVVIDYHFGAVHYLGTWYSKRGPWSGKDIGRYFADLLLAALRP